jgi:hypothetical protein
MFTRSVFLFVVFLAGMGSFFLGKFLGITSNWGELAIGGCVTALMVLLFYWLSGGRQARAGNP